MSSPTSRTLALLREQGWTAEVVERWIAQSRTRKDLFGIADIVAFNERLVMLVQTTSTPNMSVRISKIVAIPEAFEWQMHPNRLIAVIGWRKYRKAQDGKFWRPTVRYVGERDFYAETKEDEPTTLAQA